MISLITAGVLICTGLTGSYDVRFEIDGRARTAIGTLMDPDGFKQPVTITYLQLRTENGCLLSNEIKLCPSTQERVELTLHFPSEESGSLGCRPR